MDKNNSIDIKDIPLNLPYFSTSEDEFETKNNKWMKDLDDEKLISEINIPGTHDTCSLNGGYELLKCQTKCLRNQFNAGIRYLDIRGRLVNNDILIYHKDCYQNISLIEVIISIKEFLIENNSEFFVFRMKEEAEPINSNINFADCLSSIILKYNDMFIISDNLAKVSNLRGKIFLLQEKYNINAYDWSKIDLQDDFWYETMNDLNRKIIKIQSQLENSNKKIKDKIYINHLSGTGESSNGVCPYKVALVTNKYMIDYLISETKPFVGIVVMDFPGEEILNKIIS